MHVCHDEIMALTCCDSLLTARRTLLADPEYVAPGRNWTVGAGSRMVWFTLAAAGADHTGAEDHQR